MTQRHFFALPDDLVDVFQRVEAKRAISFVPTGLFETSKVTSFSSGELLPTLHTPAPNSSVQCATYLVTLVATPINVRSVPQKVGGILYAIDQLENPDSIALTHGGLCSPSVLIAGRVATVSATPAARQIQSAFSTVIGRVFTRVNAFYVGPGALDLLRQGCRLTQDVGSPPEYDLMRPRASA